MDDQNGRPRDFDARVPPAEMSKELRRRLESELPRISTGEARILAPQQLVDRCVALVEAMANGDDGAVFDQQLAIGMSFNRETCEGMASTRLIEGKVIDQAELERLRGLPDRDLYVAVCAHVRSRYIHAAAFDPSPVSFGRGCSPTLKSPEWPYGGIDAVVPRFKEPESEMRTAREHNPEGTERSAHLQLRVRWSDGNTGLIRLSFVYFDSIGWALKLFGTGSNGHGEWPNPFM